MEAEGEVLPVSRRNGWFPDSSSPIPTMVFYSLSFSFFFALLFGHGVVKLDGSHYVYDLRNLAPTPSGSQPYRTAYHFQPAMNWMNVLLDATDPNGPMVYKGIYHLFYQYSPEGAIKGKVEWAHSTSKDLVNWTPQPIAINRSESYDINGVWSGSATILPDGKPAILYTGKTMNSEQVQNLANPKDPSDPYLIEWSKSTRNPIMSSTPKNHINATSFRDPTTAWLGPDGRWRVVIGSKTNRTGLALLFTSEDFVNWTQSNHSLYSKEGTGMWECPDFYPVAIDSPIGIDASSIRQNVKHVLKVSLDETRHDVYTIGTYDPVKDSYTPGKGSDSVEGDTGLRYDYGKFYACKSFYDSIKHRRILWAWINESSSVNDDVKKGWSGIQAVPRTIVLDKFGKQLIQWPIEEIEMLRINPVELPNRVLKGGSVLLVPGVTAAQADVEISFEIEDWSQAEVMDSSRTNPQMLCSEKGASVNGSLGPFGLLVLASRGMEEQTAVFFRMFKTSSKIVVLLCSDQSRSSLNEGDDKTTYGTFVDVDPAHEKLSLRTLIDHSVVESFAEEGRSCITARVYPLLAMNEDACLYAFNYGTQSVKITKFNAWSMKEANINREKKDGL